MKVGNITWKFFRGEFEEYSYDSVLKLAYNCRDLAEYVHQRADI